MVSRSEFAKEMLKIEFEADKKTQRMLATLKFTKKEIANSHYYPAFAELPTEFEDYLTWIKKRSPQRDAFKEYELKYDWLQKKSQSPATQTNSVAPQN
jgi:hypothetical protein